MKKTNKSEELQSRREFFKKAAKSALPILAAVALASAPNIIRASKSTPLGCDYKCVNSCSDRCDGSCRTGCYLGCKEYCKGGCTGGCKSGCTLGSRY